MRIIFIFDLRVKNIQFYELVGKLQKAGFEIVVYDLINSQKYNPVSKRIFAFNPIFGSKWLLKIKYIRHYIRPIINKMVIRKEFRKYDVVNLHYLNPFYAKFGEIISRSVDKFVITFWGSDVLRANDERLEAYIPLFNSCDAICVPDTMQYNFNKIYQDYNQRKNTSYNFQDKFRTVYFGLSILDDIKNVSDNLVHAFKVKYSLPLEKKIFITIAHNASKAQQHLKLIAMLSNQKSILKDKVFILLPLTYGGDEPYKSEIETCLQNAGLQYRLFTKYLENKELAVLRVISNINLNIQTTDGFSGSISEALFAQNIVLVGDWLPYEIYEAWGVKLFRLPLADYERKMKDIIKNYDDYLVQIEGNNQNVYDKLSWKTILPKWIEIYKSS